MIVTKASWIITTTGYDAFASSNVFLYFLRYLFILQIPRILVCTEVCTLYANEYLLFHLCARFFSEIAFFIFCYTRTYITDNYVQPKFSKRLQTVTRIALLSRLFDFTLYRLLTPIVCNWKMTFVMYDRR